MAWRFYYVLLAIALGLPLVSYFYREELFTLAWTAMTGGPGL